MRTHNVIELIQYEASAKPEIAMLVERAPDMTEDEINALDLPMLWYREALKAVRFQELEKRKYSEISLSIEAAIGGQEQYVSDPMGTMAIWEKDDVYMKTATGSLLLVHYGKLIWFPDSGGLWFETSFSRDENMLFSRRLQRCTKLEYINLYKEKLLATYGNVPFTLVFDPAQQNSNNQPNVALDRYGVKFS
jgi:hypothetical protein